MYTVIETDIFQSWVDGLRDMPTRIRLRRRLGKAMRGNLGDVKAVGGGDKSSQELDIAAAKSLAKEINL